jgi:hypothetical protein
MKRKKYWLNRLVSESQRQSKCAQICIHDHNVHDIIVSRCCDFVLFLQKFRDFISTSDHNLFFSEPHFLTE